MTTTGAGRGAHTDRRGTKVLAVIALTAWIAILAGFDGGGAGMFGFVAAWSVMMVAMMLPSAMPLILLYQRGATRRATAALASGYVAVWATVGIAAWALDAAAMNIPVSAVLLAAGIYQLTPIKHACLRRCRTPADFLVEHWRANAFVLGADHGRYCLGCCWALMAVLVVAGMMGVIWVIAIAAIVAIEKLSSRGAGFARLTGFALIALAVFKALA